MLSAACDPSFRYTTILLPGGTTGTSVHRLKGEKESRGYQLIGTESGFGKLLYEAVARALDQLKEVEGRRAVILFSDGVDMRSIEATGARIAWEPMDAGAGAIPIHGAPLPEVTLASIRANRVCLKGPLAIPIEINRIIVFMIFFLQKCLQITPHNCI